ncbi:hypothetical protein [Neomoorella thermoacetica]|uniref:hypothetical protein n=1 Tax=Neomoorella thermoacetica TaxID=1525 RepID=UPI0009BD9528|nr:hypothetical protein [Moorella thermoacetica]
MHDKLRRLIDRLFRKMIVPFFGAGVSYNADPDGLTRTPDMIRRLAQELILEAKKSTELTKFLLCSHHDIITSRLLPLLLPPSGFRLKVIEFTSFRPETGPELRFYECKQARSGYIALQNVFKVEA